MRAAPEPLAAKLEKAWDADLFASGRGLARTLGWTSYHTLRSRGSAAGYPDRTLWRERVVFVELKRELTGRKREDANRRPSAAQVSILDGLARAGAEVYLWRPSDLDEIARILGKRWGFHRWLSATMCSTGEQRLPQLTTSEEVWVPQSIWIPGVGRADQGAFA